MLAAAKELPTRGLFGLEAGSLPGLRSDDTVDQLELLGLLELLRRRSALGTKLAVNLDLVVVLDEHLLEGLHVVTNLADVVSAEEAIDIRDDRCGHQLRTRVIAAGSGGVGV